MCEMINLSLFLLSTTPTKESRRKIWNISRICQFSLYFILGEAFSLYNDNQAPWTYDGDPRTCQTNSEAVDISVALRRKVYITWFRLVFNRVGK